MGQDPGFTYYHKNERENLRDTLLKELKLKLSTEKDEVFFSLTVQLTIHSTSHFLK